MPTPSSRRKASPARRSSPAARRSPAKPAAKPKAGKKDGTIRHDCPMSAGTFWRLRGNTDFETFVSLRGDNRYELLSYTEELKDGLTHVTRVSRVTANTNPVPAPLRKTLGVGHEFGFEQTETYVLERWDAAHPLTVHAKPAILGDRVKVVGTQWVEAAGAGSCQLCFDLQVSVNILGLGGKVAKGIREGTAKSYKFLPQNAADYLAAHPEMAAEATSAAGSEAAAEVPCTPHGAGRNGLLGAIAEATTEAASDKRTLQRMGEAATPKRLGAQLERAASPPRRSPAHELSHVW